jgi:hypothetical protein
VKLPQLLDLLRAIGTKVEIEKNFESAVDMPEYWRFIRSLIRKSSGMIGVAANGEDCGTEVIE